MGEKNDNLEVFQNPMIKQLGELSESFLEFKKVSWEAAVGIKDEEQHVMAKKEYQQKLRSLLEQKNNQFSDEDSCVLAKFALYFGIEVFSLDEREQIDKNLDKRKFPIISEIDQKIAFIRKGFIDFYSEEKEHKSSLFIPYSNNPLADILISTEISRLQVDRKPGSGDQVKFPVFSEKLNTGFEVSFKK